MCMNLWSGQIQVCVAILILSNRGHVALALFRRGIYFFELRTRDIGGKR
jgi:hypothetical protein